MTPQIVFNRFTDGVSQAIAASLDDHLQGLGNDMAATVSLQAEPEVQANPRFVERLQREVPLGRLVKAEEDAEFAAYLCSDKANCFVGQVFPICGGWVQR